MEGRRDDMYGTWSRLPLLILWSNPGVDRCYAIELSVPGEAGTFGPYVAADRTEPLSSPDRTRWWSDSGPARG
jgi:hypothetical protein